MSSRQALAIAVAGTVPAWLPGGFAGPGDGGAVFLVDEPTAVTSRVAACRRVADGQLDVVGEDDGVAPVSGVTMMRLSGRREPGDGPCCIYIGFSAPDSWTVTPGSRLSYCVYARPESIDYAFAVDLAAPDFYPNNLRDRPDVRDGAGFGPHPARGGGIARQVGRWRYREFSLAPLAGREITEALLAWDTGGGREPGTFVGYVDAVMLWYEGDEVAAARSAELRAACAEHSPEVGLDSGLPQCRVGAGTPLPPVDPPAVSAATDAGGLTHGHVRLGPDGYFARPDGRPFLPWGLFGSEIYTELEPGAGKSGRILWWSNVGWEDGNSGHNSEPVNGSEDDWRRYFDYCAKRGVAAMRLFTYGHTAWPGDRPAYYFGLDAVGKVHPVLWAKLDRFMQVGYSYGIRFLFTLLPSPDWSPYVRRSRPGHPENQCLAEAQRQYTLGEMATLPPYRGRFLVDADTVGIENAFSNKAYFENRDVALCVEDYLRDLLPRLVDDPRIFALEIMNETLGTAYAEWAGAHVVRLCRELCPGRPVTVSHTLGSRLQAVDAASFSRTAGLDFYNWHQYARQNAAATELLALNSLYYNAAVPGFPTEGPAYYGGWKAEDTDETQRRLAIRDYLWLPLVCGCPGSILWAPENPDIMPAEWEELDTFHRVLQDVRRKGGDVGAFERYRPPVGLGAELRHGLRVSYASEFLRRGVPFEFTTDTAGYSVGIDRPVRIDVAADVSTPVRATGSEAVRFLADRELSRAVVYAPNLVAGERGVSERRVELELRLPWTEYTVACYNLDNRTVASTSTPGHARLLMARDSKADFVVFLRGRTAP